MNPEIHEKRGKLRIAIPFHAKVHGLDVAGKPFVAETVLDNVSVTGVYLRLLQKIKVGTTLFIEFGFQSEHRLTDGDSRFACEGVVLRSEPTSGGACGVAVSFSNIRFE